MRLQIKLALTRASHSCLLRAYIAGLIFLREKMELVRTLSTIYYIHIDISRFFFIQRDQVQALVTKGIILFLWRDEREKRKDMNLQIEFKRLDEVLVTLRS